MKEKILVVDDENEITDLVALYLENEGFQVYKFYDSRKAWNVPRGRKWIWRSWIS